MSLVKVIHFNPRWLFWNGKVSKNGPNQPFQKGALQARQLSTLRRIFGQISCYVLLDFTFDNVKKKAHLLDITHRITYFEFELHTCIPIWMRQLFQISLRSQMYVWKSWINTLHLLLDLMTFNNISSSIFNQEFPVFKKK